VEFGAARLLNFFPARIGLNEFDTFSGPDDGDHGEQVLAANFGTKVTFVLLRHSCLGYGSLCASHI
jgi:hypothetical protein